ncbi:MAG: TIGR03862 family flavoprotein [Gallionellaceae bacterium]|nr:MAG: TIGR03862 family flavoprotein [Gallionellaceae bacterium]
MPVTNTATPKRIAIIGAGPAGLMATEVLSQTGVRVDVYDAMPSVGRKFLMAGKGGMNITHAEPYADFLTRYGAHREHIEPLLNAYTPGDLRAWIHGLGIATFVGTSGRVFPADMKAAPLLRAWLHRLRERGVHFHARHRWQGWDETGALKFEVRNNPLLNEKIDSEPSPAGRGQGEGTIVKIAQADAIILALGGGSWPQLGSDGTWVSLLQQRGISIAPLRPSNCGFDIAWTPNFRERYAGEPLKSVSAAFTPAGPSGDCTLPPRPSGERRGEGFPKERFVKRGECIITAHGIEGGLIYALSAALRDEIERNGQATLHLDLLPDHSLQRVQAEVSHPRGSRSLTSHLQSRLGLKGVKANLLREALSAEQMQDATLLAHTIKALPLKLIAPRPLSEAISSAGGVTFGELDEKLMLRKMPGIFCAGEMLDWEAPTGGYLLTACFASGYVAGKGVLTYLG